MKGKRYHPSVSDEQMKALRQFIAVSEDISTFGKKAVIFLLDQSENLSLPVHMSIPGEIGRKVQDGAHAMSSANCRTHIHYFFRGMGTKMRFSHHCGLFEKSGTFNAKLKGSTIWISGEFYDRKSKAISFDRKKIEKTKLPTWRD